MGFRAVCGRGIGLPWSPQGYASRHKFGIQGENSETAIAVLPRFACIRRTSAAGSESATPLRALRDLRSSANVPFVSNQATRSLRRRSRACHHDSVRFGFRGPRGGGSAGRFSGKGRDRSSLCRSPFTPVSDWPSLVYLPRLQRPDKSPERVRPRSIGFSNQSGPHRLHTRYCPSVYWRPGVRSGGWSRPSCRVRLRLRGFRCWRANADRPPRSG